ncbi:peptidase [Tasmannia lanceolata]|uniref:peptidase n=1 Tax=Tasmannia lanceolata TaxID=3420 RepID=UPI004062D55E
MASDAVLRSCLVSLGAVMVVVGIFTFSFKKMIATYAFGLFAIAGIMLPDWEFFDRKISEWFYPMSSDRSGNRISDQNSGVSRFRLYPVRLVVFTVVYGISLYKWWMFITS